MILENGKAFTWLRSRLQEFGFESPIGPSFISTTQIEKKWLKHIEIFTSNRVTHGLSTFSLNLQGEAYFLVVGSTTEQSSTDPDALQPVDMNAGLLTILLSENLVDLRTGQDGLEVYDNLMFQHLDGNYAGHDLNDFLPFLEPMALYSIPETSILSQAKLERLTCYYIAFAKHLKILPFSPIVTSFYQLIAAEGSSKIAFDLLSESLVATSFKHSFLDLYRLIERLYPIYYIRDFHSASNSSLPFLQFAALLEQTTGWRPKEESAIEKVFENCPEGLTSHFSEMLESEEKVWKYLYKLRNSIVHFRASHYSLTLETGQWNLVIQGMLNVIKYQYEQTEPLL